MVSESLREALREMGVEDESIDTVVEMEYDEYRRAMEETIAQHIERYEKVVSTYRKQQDLRNDHYVKYYTLPNGVIGYIITGKKHMGFYLPSTAEE